MGGVHDGRVGEVHLKKETRRVAVGKCCRAQFNGGDTRGTRASIRTSSRASRDRGRPLTLSLSCEAGRGSGWGPKWRERSAHLYEVEKPIAKREGHPDNMSAERRSTRSFASASRQGPRVPEGRTGKPRSRRRAQSDEVAAVISGSPTATAVYTRSPSRALAHGHADASAATPAARGRREDEIDALHLSARRT